MLLIQPVFQVLMGEADAFDLVLLLVGTVLLVTGYALLRREPIGRSLGWRLGWTPLSRSRKDFVISFLIIGGTVLLSLTLRNIWDGGTLAAEWSGFGLALLALAIGWLLAFSEFWQSRSPQK